VHAITDTAQWNQEASGSRSIHAVVEPSTPDHRFAKAALSLAALRFRDPHHATICVNERIKAYMNHKTHKNAAKFVAHGKV
jgi:hypothetical protein